MENIKKNISVVNLAKEKVELTVYFDLDTSTNMLEGAKCHYCKRNGQRVTVGSILLKEVHATFGVQKKESELYIKAEKQLKLNYKVGKKCCPRIKCTDMYLDDIQKIFDGAN